MGCVGVGGISASCRFERTVCEIFDDFPPFFGGALRIILSIDFVLPKFSHVNTPARLESVHRDETPPSPLLCHPTLNASQVTDGSRAPKPPGGSGRLPRGPAASLRPRLSGAWRDPFLPIAVVVFFRGWLCVSGFSEFLWCFMPSVPRVIGVSPSVMVV